MKRSIKIVAIIIVAFCIIAQMNNTQAIETDTYKPEKLNISDGNLYYVITGKITSILQAIGAIVCIGVLVIIGIVTMYGSVEQKAEYKKRLLPVVVGAVFVAGTSTIVKLVDKSINSEIYIKQEQERIDDEMLEKYSIDYEAWLKEGNEYIDRTKKMIEPYPDTIRKQALLYELESLKKYNNGIVIKTAKEHNLSFDEAYEEIDFYLYERWFDATWTQKAYPDDIYFYYEYNDNIYFCSIDKLKEFKAIAEELEELYWKTYKKQDEVSYPIEYTEDILKILDVREKYGFTYTIEDYERWVEDGDVEKLEEEYFKFYNLNYEEEFYDFANGNEAILKYRYGMEHVLEDLLYQ